MSDFDEASKAALMALPSVSAATWERLREHHATCSHCLPYPNEPPGDFLYCEVAAAMISRGDA